MRVPVYRNLSREPELLGLEPMDALLLGSLVWVLQTCIKPGMPVLLLTLVITYAALRLWKRGKPPGYTGTVARYAARRYRAVLSAGAIDEEGRKATMFNEEKRS
jgi:hypothetical protein